MKESWSSAHFPVFFNLVPPKLSSGFRPPEFDASQFYVIALRGGFKIEQNKMNKHTTDVYTNTRQHLLLVGACASFSCSFSPTTHETFSLIIVAHKRMRQAVVHNHCMREQSIIIGKTTHVRFCCTALRTQDFLP